MTRDEVVATRHALKLTQQKMADALGVSLRTFQRYEERGTNRGAGDMALRLLWADKQRSTAPAS